MQKKLQLLVILILCSGLTFGQNSLSGQVTDPSGESLPGVTIQVKQHPTLTSITDHEGRFTITVTNQQQLIFRMLGFQDLEINGSSVGPLSLVLQPSQTSLDEVVIVGYGTQKKLNLTGAVDQVGEEVFENRPLANVTRGLQGVIPNLNIRMTDGKPTRGATYNIRGTTSIGSGGSALVLIDGVPGEPNLLNPSDIESVTVLKDASAAAIFGARGSFGVVLITTKSPKKGKTTVNYSSNYTLNDHTIRPDLVTDGYQWAKTFNEAFSSWNDYSAFPQKANAYFPFSQDYLEEFRKRDEAGNVPSVDIDPATGKYVYYGSTDWLKELYSDKMPAMEQQVNLSGSGEKTSFYLSARYNSQGNLFRYNPDKYNMYNVRGKGTIQALDWLKIDNDISFNQMSYFMPVLNHAGNTPVWRRISDEAFPIAMLRNPDGTLTENASIVFGSFISGNNHFDELTRQTRNTTRLRANLIENKVTFNSDFTFDKISRTEERVYTMVPYSTTPEVMNERGINKMNNQINESTYLAFNAFVQYNEQLEKHNFQTLIGYNYEKSSLDRNFMERDNLINPLLPDFSLVDGQNIILTGGGNQWATLGGFFRLNYDYASKYLFEASGRYDGSSKFPKGQQYGFFPSASAGWRISEENFFQPLKNTINEFKVRASYGTLGNGNISPYQFLETMSVSRSGRMINGIRPNYTQNPSVIPAGLTWEKATTVNVGVDLALVNRKLTGTFDWYNRATKDMFTVGLPLPGVFGASVPKGNYADLETKGWELAISWKDQIQAAKPIFYDLRFSLADNRSYITKFNNPLGLIDTYYEGMEIGEIWGFKNAGFFQDEQDILNHADQSYVRVSAANKPLPGDIKFMDLDHDGVIDYGKSTLADPGDRTIIGNSNSRYTFGFNANFDWNNFFVGAFFQGVAKRHFTPTPDNSLFWGPYNRPYSWQPKDVMENIWSPENPDTYFPRLRGYTALNNRGELWFKQDRYMQNAAYVRLKNLTIGYNIPEVLLKKLNITKLGVYFTGQNLWTYSPMFKYTTAMDPENIERADPELNSGAGQGMAYPILKSYSIGLNITL